MFQFVFVIKDLSETHLVSAEDQRVSLFLPIGLVLYNPFLATTPRPEVVDPCRPSPCGINAECRERNGAASCTCLPGLQGDPYVECKHECTINPECATNLACINNKCRDPCPGVCGAHATCSVNNHYPNCQCDPGYTGDPFSACYRKTTREKNFFHCNFS